MRKMALLVIALLLTLAAASEAQPINNFVKCYKTICSDDGTLCVTYEVAC
jgi:hypothetical protein